MKICTIIGSRPQYIKHAVLTEYLRKHHEEILIDTGQHYDRNMSDVFLKDLHIPKPHYNLSIHESSQAKQTGLMMDGIEKTLLLETPDLVLTYGDTNSTLAGVIASKKLGFTTAHIESGARSYDMLMPEEINRIIADNICDILFSPTKDTYNNLKRENVIGCQFYTGDIVIESLLKNSNRSSLYSSFLESNKLTEHPYVLATIHRGFNTDSKENLSKIFDLLKLTCERVMFPVHPRTRKMIEKFSIKPPQNVKIIEPIGYIDMISAMKSSQYIITDSGGVQREAYALHKKCITLRKNTEWLHTKDGNWNNIVGLDETKFKKAIHIIPNEKYAYDSFEIDICASEKICSIIDECLSGC